MPPATNRCGRAAYIRIPISRNDLVAQLGRATDFNK
jgi:hypothetical protein